MVTMSDYSDFGQGFGTASAADVAELNKALSTGNYAQANGVSQQINGAALQVESLENSLKVLTFTDQHVKFWKKIAKTPAYSTVESTTSSSATVGITLLALCLRVPCLRLRTPCTVARRHSLSSWVPPVRLPTP